MKKRLVIFVILAYAQVSFCATNVWSYLLRSDSDYRSLTTPFPSQISDPISKLEADVVEPTTAIKSPSEISAKENDYYPFTAKPDNYEDEYPDSNSESDLFSENDTPTTTQIDNVFSTVATTEVAEAQFTLSNAPTGGVPVYLQKQTPAPGRKRFSVPDLSDFDSDVNSRLNDVRKAREVYEYEPTTTAVPTHEWKDLRNERVNASICPESEEDLCSSAIPEMSRQRCKCDYECSIYDDCCVDIITVRHVPLDDSPAAGFTWVCHDKGFYVVRSCPASWPITEEDGSQNVRRRCEWETEAISVNVTYLQEVPVFAERTGIMYRNVFCALCNRDHKDLRAWHTKIICDNEALPGTRVSTRLHVTFDAKFVQDLVEMGNITYHEEKHEFHLIKQQARHRCILDIDEFRAPDFVKAYVLRPCTDAIGLCQTSFLNEEESELASKCHSYTSLVHDKITRRNYKNYHCALCDGVRKRNLACGAYVPKINWDKYMMTRVAYTRKLEIHLWPWKENAIYASQLPCRQNELYDELLRFCVPIGCPDGFVWLEDKCHDILETLPNPYTNENLTCQLQRLEFKFVTPMKYRKLYVNHTNEILEPEKYKLLMNENNVTTTAFICAGKFVSFEWDSLVFITTHGLAYISALGALCVMIVHIVVYDLRNQSGKIIAATAASLVVANLSFVMIPYPESFSKSCEFVGILSHYFHMVVFFWMNVMAIDIYRVMHMYYQMGAKQASVKKYGMYAWSGAGVIVAAAFVTDKLMADTGFEPLFGSPLCWIATQDGFIVFFVGPGTFIQSISIGAMVLCVPRLCSDGGLQPSSKQAPSNYDHSESVERFMVCSGVLIIMSITWISAFCAITMDMAGMWTPFAVCYGFQGIFLFFATTCRPKIIAAFVDEILQRDSRHRSMRSAGVLVSSAKDLPALVAPLDRSNHEPTPMPESSPRRTASEPYRRHLTIPPPVTNNVNPPAGYVRQTPSITPPTPSAFNHGGRPQFDRQFSCQRPLRFQGSPG